MSISAIKREAGPTGPCTKHPSSESANLLEELEFKHVPVKRNEAHVYIKKGPNANQDCSGTAGSKVYEAVDSRNGPHPGNRFLGLEHRVHVSLPVQQNEAPS